MAHDHQLLFMLTYHYGYKYYDWTMPWLYCSSFYSSNYVYMELLTIPIYVLYCIMWQCETVESVKDEQIFAMLSRFSLHTQSWFSTYSCALTILLRCAVK